MPAMTIESVLRWIVLGGVFALPFLALIVAESLFFPFITGKGFTFRIIVEVIAGAWLALALVNPAYRPQRSWMLAAFTLFVALIAISNAMSPNALKSFWSNYERMEGWVTLAHLLVYFIVATSVLTTKRLWHWFWHTSVGVSVLIALYGLLQLFGFITINQGGIRLDATFGNATYLAVYMLFHIFITALLWAHMRAQHRTHQWLLGSLYGGIILLQIFVLFFTATRGAILGFIGGAFLTSLILVLLARNSKHAWRAATGVVALIILLAGTFFVVKDQAWVEDIEPLRRIASISLTETTTAARFMNWNMAWQGVQERPLFGWGQESYNIVFNKYYDPGMYAQEPWFDRVHNIFLDWLIAGGFLGLLGYLSLYALALWYIWGRGAFTVPERAILTGLLAAYSFHNLFVFDNLISYILFISFLAYLTVRVFEARGGGAPLLGSTFILPRKALPILAIVAVLGVWGTAYVVNAAPLSANRALIAALQPPQTQEDLLDRLQKFENAIGYQTYGTQEAREQLMQGAMRVLQTPEVSQEIKARYAEAATRELLAQTESAPQDARAALFLGSFLDALGAHEDAQVALERAQALSPNKQTIHFQRAVNALNQGEQEEALTIFRTAYELEPAFDNARLLYAVSLINGGDIQTADNIVTPLIASGAATDPRLINAYVAQNAYDRVLPIWQARVAQNPEDLQAHFALSAVYFALGDQGQAIAALENAAAVNPGARGQVDALIEQIRSGEAVLQ